MIMNTRPLLLVVDDEPAICHMLKQSLEDEHYAVQTISDGHKTLETIGKLVPDLVLLDIFMPNCNGIEVLVKIKQEYPSQSVMMLSGFGTIQIATDAIKKGAVDFIEKPFNFDDILAKISLARSLQTSTKNDLEQTLDYTPLGIVGASSLFRELLNHVAMIAPLNMPVLIHGPSGSGKSLIAQYIHTKGQQSQHSFVEINATQNQDLRDVNLSRSCTIYIKNIHCLSNLGQQNLLAYLRSEKHFARIIAATGENLFSIMQQGKFDASLFALFQSTPVQIPALNKRRYDIPLLVYHFVQKSNSKYNKSIVLTPGATRILRNRAWYGDVAELKLYIDSLIASTQDPFAVIDLSGLPNDLHSQPLA
jgi:two-component system nitrogen regulation response regulator NtrX